MSDTTQTVEGNNNGRKKKDSRKLIIPIIALVIIVSLVLVGIVFFSDESDDEKSTKKTILEGKGLDEIRIGDDLSKIVEIYGEPEDRTETDTTIWVVYRDKNGLDFLLLKETEKIEEIRFNPGFDGSLPSGITIGSKLDSVLNEYGGPKKTVRTNSDGVRYSVFGKNKILYEQVDENGDITVYKFVNLERGIGFWFNPDKNVTQIVVKDPSDGKYDIASGWLGIMQRTDMEERIKGWYGEPEDKVVTNNTIWIKYHEVAGLDFLIDNTTKKVLEVRFNEGFDWATINQVSIGSSLDDVLDLNGGANRIVQISSDDSLNLSHGTDKVLYEIVDGANNIVHHKFIDSKMGIMYWFDGEEKCSQIVLFDPY